MTRPTGPDEQWAHARDELLRVRQAEREEWGAVDDFLLARYLAGRCSEADRQRVQEALAQSSRVRYCVAVLQNDYPAGDDSAPAPPSELADPECWAWLQRLPDLTFPGGTSVQWSLPPGVVAVDSFKECWLLTVRFGPVGPLPPLAFGLTAAGNDRVQSAGRLNGLGQALFPPGLEGVAYRLHFTPSVRAALDVEILQTIGGVRSVAQLQAAQEDDTLPAALRWLAVRARLRAEVEAVSTRTEHLLSFIEGRQDWLLSKRVAHYSQALTEFEPSLAVAAGPATPGLLAGDAAEPFGVLFTAVTARTTRWRLGNPRLLEVPTRSLRPLTAHPARLNEAVRLEDGNVVVNGSLLQPGDEGAFLAGSGEAFDVERDEAFVVRRVEAPEGLTPEELSRHTLFVDAWAAKAADAGPGEELAEFLCAFVIAPMMRAFGRFDRDRLEDGDVRDEWRFLPRRLAKWRDELLQQWTSAGGGTAPSP
jgi:hypothetical protein